jgi:3-oxoacyl-[acyl-carrier protein] reductase
MSRFEGKVALITGGGRGIGRSIALTFSKQGAHIVICGRNEGTLQAVAKEIADQTGLKTLMSVCDVAKSDQVIATVKKTLDTFSRIDILVNNAGVTRDQLIAMMSERDWDEVLTTNLKSAFLFIKTVTRPMLRQRSGRIINIASVIGITGNAGQANYAAAKGGMIALTKSAAKELARRNITVNAIAPGFIETAMTTSIRADAREALLKEIPVGRFGTPDDVAQATAYLASDEASYITGQVIHVCGGMVM